MTYDLPIPENALGRNSRSEQGHNRFLLFVLVLQCRSNLFFRVQESRGVGLTSSVDQSSFSAPKRSSKQAKIAEHTRDKSSVCEARCLKLAAMLNTRPIALACCSKIRSAISSAYQNQRRSSIETNDVNHQIREGHARRLARKRSRCCTLLA
jgi:hypothetical protein